MAEWLYEAGIGEARAALVEDGDIVEAAIEPDDGGPRVGTVAEARLIDRATGLVRLDGGAEALLNGAAPVAQGGALTVRIVREAIAEPGRVKPPRAVPTDEEPRPGPDLLARLQAISPAETQPLPRRRPGPSHNEFGREGHRSNSERFETGPRPSPGKRVLTTTPIRHLTAHGPDLLEQAGWSELLEEARTGDIAFLGGSLRMWPTPAMTLFDVDGGGALDALAIAAAQAVARAVRRHGLGGSIGVDFPTLAGKAQRQAVAAALDAALPQPFERTAVNGFGFLQIVRPRPRMSLPERRRADPAGADARALLRRLEREPPGAPAAHRVPPRTLARLQARPDWLAELARRTGVTHTLSREAGEGQPRNAAG